MSVPLLDLTRQYRPLRDEISAAIDRVCDSQRFILGAEVEDFESEAAEMLGVAHSIGVTSGTDALLASLMALGVGAGDEVVIPTFTFFATAGVVARLGARPVFVDVDPVDYCMDPQQLRDSLTSRTRAVMPVHLFGQAADMEAIMEAAGDVPVIEDCAQAWGADCGGRPVGSIGRMGAFSFFPSKNIGCFGDGGLITTHDDALAHSLRELRVHGQSGPYLHPVVGGNFRLDSLQAAILRVKLPHVAGWVEGRRANANRYRRLFVEAGLAHISHHLATAAREMPQSAVFPRLGVLDVPQVRAPRPSGRKHHTSRHLASLATRGGEVCGLGDAVELPQARPGRGHTFNQFVIRVERRDDLRAFLGERGIGAAVYYPLPLHLQPCFVDLGCSEGEFPVSEQASREVLALPVYPELTAAEQEEVVGAIAEFFAR